MSWRDDMYSDSERSLLREVRRLRKVVIDLENENTDLKQKIDELEHRETE